MGQDGSKLSSEVVWELHGPDGELKANGSTEPKETKEIPR